MTRIDLRTRRYIERRIAAGVWAAQIKQELLTQSVRVPFVEILAFDPERKGESELARHQRDENREMLRRSMASGSIIGPAAA